MKFIKVKTRAFLPPRDNIYELLDKIKTVKEGDIILITSKVLAIHQGRCIKIEPHVDKKALIKKEAEKYLEADHIQNHKFILTVKYNTLICSAGIDESNGNGYYVLWPKEPNRLLKEFHSYLTKRHRIKNLGLITTDSHFIPMRSGIVGISIGFYGFEPLIDYRNYPDIFGRKLKFTQVNMVDPLAAIGVFIMGESDERTPMLIIRGIKAKFTTKNTYRKLIYPFKQDIYYPLLKAFEK
jgi:F420-0:gamma-glutamyl ligase